MAVFLSLRQNAREVNEVTARHLKHVGAITAIFVVAFGVSYAQAVASNTKVAARCQDWLSEYPPAIAANTLIVSGAMTMNENDLYVNRDYTAKQYFPTGLAWWSQTESAGTRVDQYYDAGHANYPGAQGGVYNRTYGAATGWWIYGYYSC